VSEKKHKPAGEYVVIRHRPGYRLRRSAILLVFSVVTAVLGYVVGVTYGSGRLSGLEESQGRLAEELQKVREGYTEARQRVITLERGRSIDQQALKVARRTIVELETEMAALRADLSFYRNIMAPSETSKGLQVDRLQLHKGHLAHQWDFRLTLVQVGNNKSYISGVVAVNLIGRRDGEREVIALRDLSEQIDDLGVKFRFRYFQDVEGTLQIPDGFRPVEVQVVARADGGKSSRAERTFDWQELTEN
jgi:hypothetical protein